MNPFRTFRPVAALRAALLMLCFIGGAAMAAVGQSDDFLEPELAFRLQPHVIDAQRIGLRFDIAPGYYLYREKFVAEFADAVLPLRLPPGKVKFDETFQKEVETFREQVAVVAEVSAVGTEARHLTVSFQGCADRGLCYPPMQRVMRVEADGAGSIRLAQLDPDPSARWLERRAAAPTASDPFATALQSRGLLQVIGVFLVAGLLLSLTPCVLPMVPILSSIIVGQSGAVSRARGFTLALAYALGMAMVYTAFGMLAGLMGEGLAASLQNAWVLGAFALLLSALSLSMFGVYELQMPSALQSRITQWSGGLKGGQYSGVFVMGGLSALIVGPCVAAPLAGALVYISQTRDVVLGGAALFALASGMSVPLLLVGVSAGSLLPRAGAWMERIKHLFGFMLLGVALWMVAPVVPPWLFMLLAATLLLALAVVLGAFERLPESAGVGRAAFKGIGLTFAVLATLVLAGVASGGRELLQPLAHLRGLGTSATAQNPSGNELDFRAVASADVAQAVATSAQPVMLDIYADWCVACKEFEAITLKDPAVRNALAGYTLLRVDVTSNSPQDKALMREHALFGPPALLFFGPRGRTLDAGRVIGFQGPADFSASLARMRTAL